MKRMTRHTIGGDPRTIRKWGVMASRAGGEAIYQNILTPSALYGGAMAGETVNCFVGAMIEIAGDEPASWPSPRPGRGRLPICGIQRLRFQLKRGFRPL